MFRVLFSLRSFKLIKIQLGNTSRLPPTASTACNRQFMAHLRAVHWMWDWPEKFSARYQTAVEWRSRMRDGMKSGGDPFRRLNIWFERLCTDWLTDVLVCEDRSTSGEPLKLFASIWSGERLKEFTFGRIISEFFVKVKDLSWNHDLLSIEIPMQSYQSNVFHRRNKALGEQPQLSADSNTKVKWGRRSTQKK